MDTRRNLLKKKRRVVIKIGSSSLQHTETGDMDYIRLEVLVRELCNLKNQGKDVVLVSSGAIAQGKKAVHLTPEQLQEKHALQARVYSDVLHKAGFEAVTVKFVRVEQPDPTIFVEPAEPQVVTYNF